MIERTASPKLELVLTTESGLLQAEYLAKVLLQRRLASCVSFQDICSHYWWKGKLEQAKEVQLLIKTTSEQLDSLREAIYQLHSYETPELIHWSACASKNYGDWVRGELQS